MKNLIFTFSIILIFTSGCLSPQKLMEKRRYEDAITKGVKKLKKGKINDVKIVEKSFKIFTQGNLNKASILKKENRGENWDELHTIFENQKRVQSLLRPYLPIQATNGYVAKIKFIKVNQLISEAKKKKTDYHYQTGLNLLKKAKNGSRDYARKAYSEFKIVKQNYKNYEDTNELIEESLNLGISRVFINIENSGYMFIPRPFKRALLDIDSYNLNEKWIKFYAGNEIKAYYDYKATLVLTDIDVSREKLSEREFIERKTIKEKRTVSVPGKDGKSNTTKEIYKEKEVKAVVTEISQHKATVVKGTIRIEDLATGELLKSFPLLVETVFENLAIRYTGDERALNKEQKKFLNNRVFPFPHDEDMILDAAELMKSDFKSIIDKNLHLFE